MKEKMLNALLKLARKTIDAFVGEGRIIEPEEVEEIKACKDKELWEKRGAFVTIYKKPGKSLRGCIGFPYAIKPLAIAVRDAAIEATRDPRFPPLSKEELKDTIVEVSVLSAPEEIKERSWQGKLEAIEPYKDGIILRNGFYEALFLPQVWEELPDKETFLAHLSMKAGLPPHAWKFRDTVLYKFRVDAVEEKP